MNSKQNVPNPWESVRTEESQEGCSAKVWGRIYKTENNLLFSSIVSQSEELLYAPIKISAGENRKEIIWRDTDVFMGESNDERSVIYSTAQSDAFIVNVCATVEFDGCVIADVKLMPKGYTVPQLFGLEKQEPPKTSLDYFYIEIPIKKKFAKLYHLYPSAIMPSDTGDTSGSKMYAGSGFLPEKKMNSEFCSVVFLGNDEKGLFTYIDSDRGWQPESPEKAIEFISDDEFVTLRFRVIDGQPKAWAEINEEYGQYEYPALSYRFGFQATPVKPFPKNPYEEKRLHIDCFKKIPQEYFDFLSHPVVEGSDEIGFDRIKRLGVTTLILHEKWNQVQNYWKLTSRTEKQLERIIKECHKRGIKVVPYFGYELSTMSDIWHDKSELYKREGREMRKGLGWYRFPAQREEPVCYNSPIADEFANGLEKLVDQFDFDGVYLDGTAMVWNCHNTLHGCGYYDDEGKLHSTFPIFGVRRLMKKLYEIFESRGKTVNCHVSDCVCPAGIAFSHALWLGEYIQYSLVKEGAEEMPEGYLRATHSGRNFGLPTEFIVYENKPVWGFDDAFAFSLLNGVLPRPNDIGQPLEKLSLIWKILDDFPISRSEWCPFYGEKLPFCSLDNRVKISGYHFVGDGCEEWLLFLANTKTDEISGCVITGFDKCNVINAISGEVMTSCCGKLSLVLNRFGHYILKVRMDEMQP